MTTIVIDEGKIDSIIEKVVKKLRDKIIREIFSDILEILREMAKNINMLAEAQQKTEERLAQLAQRVDQLTEQVRQLTQRVNQLAQRVDQLTEQVRQLTQRVDQLAGQLNQLAGEVGRIDGKVIELHVINALSVVLRKYGFEIYSSGIPDVDAVIEGDNFIALVEICKTCDTSDVEQIIRGAKKYEEIEGVKPNILVIYSYTGKPTKKVIEEAEKHGIIIEHGIRRLANKLLKLISDEQRSL